MMRGKGDVPQNERGHDPHQPQMTINKPSPVIFLDQGMNNAERKMAKVQ